jgi:hypothetical protein
MAARLQSGREPYGARRQIEFACRKVTLPLILAKVRQRY